MRRTNWKTVSTLVTTIVIAGCQENTVSAPQATTAGPVSIMMAPEGAPTLSLSKSNKGNDDIDFTVSPNGGIYFIGSHAIVFPARSICDPAKSSYGPGTWDSPCEAITAPLKVHATIRTAKLGTWVDFTPSLRFVPSENSNRWVWIYMSTPQVAGLADFSKFSIFYTPKIGAAGVDEAKSDGTLRTYVDTWGGISTRRIKHFSGYMMSSGRSCDPQVESECYPSP